MHLFLRGVVVRVFSLVVRTETAAPQSTLCLVVRATAAVEPPFFVTCRAR